jgi:hypothetical protein
MSSSAAFLALRNQIIFKITQPNNPQTIYSVLIILDLKGVIPYNLCFTVSIRSWDFKNSRFEFFDGILLFFTRG